MKTQALVVSLHDVSPHTRPACERIIMGLRALGSKAFSLLVIPNHHCRGHFLEDPAFCEWLKTQVQRGNEIVTHGYFHQRARRAGESTLQKLMTRVYTADEGEFYDLDGQGARDLVGRANAEFAQLGVAPRGFIAPAWLLGSKAEGALREMKIEYTTRLGSVIDLRTNTTHRSQSLVWSARSAGRRLTSIAWNALLFARLHSNPLLRISIHPMDIEHTAIWRQIRACVSRALATRVPMTYGRWIDSH
jgi:predicted deacetylase